MCSNAHELIVVSYASSRRKTSLDQLSVAVKEGGDIFLDLLQTACVPKWREARQATSSARQSLMKKIKKYRDTPILDPLNSNKFVLNISYYSISHLGFS